VIWSNQDVAIFCMGVLIGAEVTTVFVILLMVLRDRSRR
jgi:hypothetical protein